MASRGGRKGVPPASHKLNRWPRPDYCQLLSAAGPFDLMANCFERRAVNRNLLAADRPRPLLRIHNELRNGHPLREVSFLFFFIFIFGRSFRNDRSISSTSSIRIFLSLVGRLNCVQSKGIFNYFFFFIIIQPNFLIILSIIPDGMCRRLIFIRTIWNDSVSFHYFFSGEINLWKICRD